MGGRKGGILSVFTDGVFLLLQAAIMKLWFRDHFIATSPQIQTMSIKCMNYYSGGSWGHTTYSARTTPGI